MIVNINSEIKDEVFEKLVKAYNERKENEIVTIYLNSEGGDVEAMTAIIDLISLYADKSEIIAYGKIASAAFDIFFQSLALRKGILPETIGMAHCAGISVNLIAGNKACTPSDKFYIEWNKKSRDQAIQFYKKVGFTNQELSKIKQGGEVWFHTDRLIEFMKRN